MISLECDINKVFIPENKMEIKSLVSMIASNLDYQTALESPKIFHLKTTIGKEMTTKLICAVLVSFCDSIKATRTMDAIDTIECAELLQQKYSHDSIKDIMLALRNAKMKGMTFYNAIDVSVIMGICEEYFENKAKYLESRHNETKNKSGFIRDETTTLLVGFEEAMEKKQKANDEAKRIAAEKRQIELLKIQNQILGNES